MSEDRQPGYDFFPPPPTTQAAPPSAPPPPRAPALGNGLLPQQSQWPQPAGWVAGIPPVRRAGVPKWLIALIAIFVVMFGTAILAAIAIPVFLNQRLKAEHQATTVRLPATFDGHERNTGTKAETLRKTFAVGQIRAEDVAVYGKVGPEVVVVVALKPPTAWSELRQKAERNDLERSLAAQGTPLILIQEPDPGELGGWIGCGPTDAGLEICLATSVGSFITVISAAGGDNPVALLRQARAAAVHRS